VRQGVSEEESTPIILVSIACEDNDLKRQIRERISKFFEEPFISQLRISFEKSTFHRTIGHALPPICNPENNSFQESPSIGASVGIGKRTDSTATLGGYIMVDGLLCIMTVDHLVPNELADDPLISITHPSEQESVGQSQWNDVWSYLPILKECCSYCFAIWKLHNGLHNMYKSVEPFDSSSACPTAITFRSLKEEFFKKWPSLPLGRISHRSKTRSRPSLEGRGNVQVEMDWSIVTLESWPHALDEHAQEISQGLHLCSISPGTLVKAIGRTSGEQVGQINTARCLINHGTRFTQEWTIVKDPQSSLSDWISGGIGVDGDSGAWVTDRTSNALYGIVWGRDRVTSNPITLFSPILDVIADIKEVAGTQAVCLPREKRPSLSPRYEGSEKNVFTMPHSQMRGPALSEEGFGGAVHNSMPDLVSATGIR
jgi:hypothetical protein